MKPYRFCSVIISLSIVFVLTVIFFSCGTLEPENENQQPEITLNGNQVDTIGVGHSYIDPGATASDPEDGDLTSRITVNGTVDSSMPGSHTISYNVKDSEGKSATITRTVWVVDNTIELVSPDCPAIYDNTSVTYRITKSFVVPSGCSVTFGPNTRIEVLANITINGELLVQEGARFLFDENIYLLVDEGILNIEGNDSALVRLENYSSGKYWGHGDDNSGWYARYAIRFGSNANANSSIEYCVFDSATVAVYCEKDGVTLSNCTFSNCAYTGVYFSDAGPKDSASFVNNSFINNGKNETYFPMHIEAAYLSRLSGSSVFNNNAISAVAVEGEDIRETGTWKKLDVPYVFRDYSNIDNVNGVVITIEPGAKFAFLEDKYLVVRNGTLIAEGTPEDVISFSNFEDGKYWGHGDDNSGWYSRYAIRFGSGANANSSLKYCTFDSATVAIYCEKDGISISNCTFKNCAYAGTYFSKCGPKDSISFVANSFVGNGKSATYFPMYIEATYLSRLSGTSIFSENAINAVAVEGEEIAETGTWKKLGVPYVFRDYAVVNNENGVVITIEPGTDLRFLGNMYLKVNNGTLIAEGTATDSIRFSNYTDGKFWGHGDLNSGLYSRYGLSFTSNANANSSLKYCIIDSAVVGINIDEAAISVSHCSIRNCQSHGIYSYGAGNTTIDEATISFEHNGESPNHRHED